MNRVILVLLASLFVLIPVGASAQVEFEEVRGPEGDISPKDQRRMEMLEQFKGRKAPLEVVERRRERLKRVAQLRSNPAFEEEFKKYYRRLAAIVRIHQLAKQSGNTSLAERSQELLKKEVERHTRTMKDQVERLKTDVSPTSGTDGVSESSDP